jgi:hypothetical protein
MTRITGLLLLLGSCWAAFAQQSPDPMETCAALGDASARLACFDHEIQRRHAATATANKPVDSTPAAAAPAPLANRKPADDTIGLDGKQLSIRRKQEGIAPAPRVLIVAKLTQLQPRPGHQYYFELDNGQVWESVDNQGQLLLGTHETVSIRPGVLGAFLLKTEAGNSIRVHRLR